MWTDGTEFKLLEEGGCCITRSQGSRIDPVIVVDAGHAEQSRIISPQVLPFTWRNKFSTLIADVATTGNSGSGVFDPNHKCLLGIMSRKIYLPLEQRRSRKQGKRYRQIFCAGIDYSRLLTIRLSLLRGDIIRSGSLPPQKRHRCARWSRG